MCEKARQGRKTSIQTGRDHGAPLRRAAYQQTGSLAWPMFPGLTCLSTQAMVLHALMVHVAGEVKDSSAKQSP